MICKHALPLIPLWAGGDLEGDEHVSLERHLESCNSCRAKAGRAQQAVHVLQSGPLPPSDPETTVWPAVARRVTAGKQRGPFNPWLPALAIGAAVLLVLTAIGPPHRYENITIPQAPDGPAIRAGDEIYVPVRPQLPPLGAPQTPRGFRYESAPRE